MNLQLTLAVASSTELIGGSRIVTLNAVDADGKLDANASTLTMRVDNPEAAKALTPGTVFTTVLYAPVPAPANGQKKSSPRRKPAKKKSSSKARARR